MKNNINGQGHMTKIAKTFKNLLLQNQKAYDFETLKHQAMSSIKFV